MSGVKTGSRWAALGPLVLALTLPLAPASPTASAAVVPPKAPPPVPTAPVPPSEAPLKRIAFGSCLSQGDRQHVWEAIVRLDPQLFLFLGDAVSADETDPVRLRATWGEFAAVPGFRKLREKTPVLATWEGGDFGDGDGSTDPAKKAALKTAFLDFWGEPADSPRRQRPGVYEARVFGPPGRRLQVILLDTSWDRSRLKKRMPWDLTFGPYAPDKDPRKHFLGPEQWAWLKEQLLVPAEVRLLCSPIQVVPSDHDFEKWGNFPVERSRLFELLRETKANGLVVLSGNRHFAELSMANAGIGYPLWDLTSSGMNNAAWNLRPDEENDHRVDGTIRENNFGAVLVDWDAGTLTLQVRSEEGTVRLERKISFADLRPRPSPAPESKAAPPLPPAPGAPPPPAARR